MNYYKKLWPIDLNRLFIFIFLLLPMALMARGGVIRGVAYLYNGRNAKTLLDSVRIKVSCADEAMSDSNGGFELKFTNLEKGQKISVVDIDRPGFVLFNQDEVNHWSTDDANLVLVMCKKIELDSLKKKVTDLATKNYNEQYKKEQAIADTLFAEKWVTEQEFHRRLMESANFKEHSLNDLAEQALSFARTDETKLYQWELKALDSFYSGDVAGAVALMESQVFEQTSRMVTEKNMRSFVSPENESMKKDSLIKELNLLVSLYRMQGGTIAMYKAWDSLKMIASSISPTMDSYERCAMFASSQNWHSDEMSYYDRAYREAKTDYDRALFTDLSANMLLYYNALFQAERRFLKAQKLWTRLSKKTQNSEYEEKVAITHINLGAVYHEGGHNSLALNECEEAVKQMRVLVNKDPKKYTKNLTITLKNLASLYLTLNLPQKADEFNLECLDLSRKALEEGTVDKNLFVCFLLSGACSKSRLGDFASCQKFAEEALKMDSTQKQGTIYLAASFLFQSRFEDSKKLYLEL